MHIPKKKEKFIALFFKSPIKKTLFSLRMLNAYKSDDIINVLKQISCVQRGEKVKRAIKNTSTQQTEINMESSIIWQNISDFE